MAELERRKITVINVATELFIAQGYAETSLVDIAKRAGVATRTLYQHFGDKEAIFREVVYSRRSASLIPAPPIDSDASLFDALAVVAHSIYDFVLLEHSLDLMHLMVAESRRFPELIADVANKVFARINANITAIFAMLAQRSHIPEDDHSETARFYLDLMLGNTAMMNYTRWASNRPDDAELGKRLDLFILGRFGPSVAKKARCAPKKRRVASVDA